jgi:hypothetical protein
MEEGSGKRSATSLLSVELTCERKTKNAYNFTAVRGRELETKLVLSTNRPTLVSPSTGDVGFCRLRHLATKTILPSNVRVVKMVKNRANRASLTITACGKKLTSGNVLVFSYLVRFTNKRSKLFPVGIEPVKSPKG